MTGGLTGNYITPYALTLQATTQQIGYLSSFPSFANMLVLLMAPMLSERAGSRKAFYIPAILVHALMWLPILAIPWVFQTNQAWWLIVFVTFATAANSIAGPPWSSMMADLAPPQVRGSFFAVRNRINGFVSLVASFVTAGLLQIFTGNTRLAFAIIFAGALVARIVSAYYLYLMTEPHPSLPKNTPRDSMLQIAKGLPSTNLGRFILFTVFLNMSQNISAPFFSAYLLRELRMSYLNYQLVNTVSAVVTMFMMTWWGKRADRAGNVKVLRITTLLIPFIPPLFVVNSSVPWLSLVQVYSGIAWAGYNLCAGLFVYDAAPQENRTRYIALFGALGAVGATVGSLLGGNLGPHLPRINGSYFVTLFLLSGIARLAVVIGLFRHIHEVRDVAPTKTTELIFGGFHPPWQNHRGGQ